MHDPDGTTRWEHDDLYMTGGVFKVSYRETGSGDAFGDETTTSSKTTDITFPSYSTQYDVSIVASGPGGDSAALVGTVTTDAGEELAVTVTVTVTGVCTCWCDILWCGVAWCVCMDSPTSGVGGHITDGRRGQ